MAGDSQQALDKNAIMASFEANGVLLCKGVLHTDQHKALLAEMKDLLALGDTFVKSANLADPTARGLYDRIARELRTLGEETLTVHFSDIPGGAVLTRVLLSMGRPAIIDILETLGRSGKFIEIGSRPNVHKNTPAAWHQDIVAYGPHKEGLTIWIPLTPCGVNAPSFQFLVPKSPLTKPLTRALTEGDGGVANEALNELLGDYGQYAPTYEVGDFAVFNGYVPHRTYQTDSMTMTRTSIEVRVY